MKQKNCYNIIDIFRIGSEYFSTIFKVLLSGVRFYFSVLFVILKKMISLRTNYYMAQLKKTRIFSIFF